MQASRQFAVQQTLMEHCHFVVKMLAHVARPRRREPKVESILFKLASPAPGVRKGSAGEGENDSIAALQARPDSLPHYGGADACASVRDRTDGFKPSLCDRGAIAPLHRYMLWRADRLAIGASSKQGEMRSFFREHLERVRGVTPHTVRADDHRKADAQ